jgi:hypothetical protein
MKAKINSDGRLLIERAGKFRKQECIFKKKNCGHWCPHFGEPKTYRPNNTDFHQLEVCQNKILMLECAVIDERGKCLD